MERIKGIQDIPLSKIDPFPDHPYKVRDDEDMEHLVESIRANGIITPCIVRPKKDGRFEMISGHRRMRACEILGISSVRCEVRELSKEEATILMVESNFQRESILPSEKAFSYKMRLDAMKLYISRMVENQKAGRNFGGAPVEPQLRRAQDHLNRAYGVPMEDVKKIGSSESRRHSHSDVSPLGTRKGRSTDCITAETGDSKNQIYRYIRLTELIPELLELVDNGNMALRPAVELSYLDNKQKDVYDFIQKEQCTPTHAQARRMRNLYAKGELSLDAIEKIMREEKANQVEKISFRADRIAKLFPKNLPPSRREEYVAAAMEHYAKHLQRKSRGQER